MIVFDASGSMAGNTSQGIATTEPRIDEVRSALERVAQRHKVSSCRSPHLWSRTLQSV